MTCMKTAPIVSFKKDVLLVFWDVSICCCRSFPCVAKRIRKPHSRGDVLIFIIHIFVYSYLYLFIGSCFANLPIASCAVSDC